MKDKGRGLAPGLSERLKAYRALEHPIRLKAYIAIHDEPDLSFNRLIRKLSISSGLAAYHIGVLRVAGLIDVEYVRKSRETSEYRLSETAGKSTGIWWADPNTPGRRVGRGSDKSPAASPR